MHRPGQLRGHPLRLAARSCHESEVIAMNISTLLVLALLAGVVALVIRTMRHDKKRGRSCCGGGSDHSCRGNCAKCRGCH